MYPLLLEFQEGLDWLFRRGQNKSLYPAAIDVFDLVFTQFALSFPFSPGSELNLRNMPSSAEAQLSFRIYAQASKDPTAKSFSLRYTFRPAREVRGKGC